ncbi:MAG: hypothetical protein JNM81_16205 [Rhodospirillaceae bacterium]|nr:hypothetical protein [Rhodospirillaceae bacterium]
MAAVTEPLDWGVAELAAQIRKRAISSVEYASLLQKHCAAHADLNGFIHQDFDQLRAAARAADAVKDGALRGVPIALKDNIDTKDAPTSGGTLALKANVPPADAPVWQALHNAGAVLAGKVNMHELASGGSTENMAFGAAKNPYDITRSPGGSSGGCGVVLAARLSPGALGSDTAGSVRVPAALCGVVGLRPSHGRYSGAGVIPLAPSRDTVGPMARSVDDTALLDAIITGDAPSLDAVSLRDVRLGVDRTRFFAGADAAVLQVIDQALETLTRAGVTFVDVSAEPDRTLSTAASGAIFENEFATGYEVYLKASAPKFTLATIHAQIASPSLKARWTERLAKPAMPNPEAYRKAMTEMGPALRAAHAQLFADHKLDALIMPTAPQAALPFGGDDNVMIGGKSVSSWLMFVNTAYAPVRGIPSISLPAGLTPQNLPIGLQLDGARGADRRLLGVAKAVEAALGVSIRPTVSSFKD